MRWGGRAAGKILLALLAFALIAVPGLAEARRRIVILDFDGPKAAQFRVDVERIVKKSHQVIPVEKWNAAAEEMDATSLSEKDVKKVAKRLNVDGVISGKIEKRRDEYILRLKVREGKSGELVGNPIDSKTGGARLDGAATREIKAELFDTLDVLDTGGGGDEEAEEEEEGERPRKFVKRGSSSEEEEEEAEEEKPAKGKKGKPVEEEEEEEEVAAKPLKGKKGKPVEEEEEEEEVAAKPLKGKPVEETKPVKGKPIEEAKPVKGKPVEEVKPTKGGETTVAVKGKPVEPVKATPTKVEPPTAETKPKKEPLLASAEEEEEEEEKEPPKEKPFVPKTKPKKAKPKKAAKEVASDEEVSDDNEISDSFEPLTSDVALNHANRAIDVTGGMSFTQRRLRFRSAGLAAPATPPRSYDSVPVAGFTVDGEAYPLALGHKRRGVITNIGVTASFDRTFSIRTRLRYNDAQTGAAREKELQSTYQRFGIGAIYRHNLGTPEKPLVVTGALRFGSQSFSVDRGGLDAKTVDIPAVAYTFFEPSAGIKYGLGRKMAVGAEAGILLMTGTGDIQSTTQYGASTVTGFEGEAFFDYMITKNVFARAAFRAETIGFKFKGYGMLSNMRDSDPEQDVTSARDSYFGGAVTAGYAF